MERSKAGTKEKVGPDSITKSKHNVTKHNMVVFYKMWKNYNEIQLGIKLNYEQNFTILLYAFIYYISYDTRNFVSNSLIILTI